jgi:hypothetical protein
MNVEELASLSEWVQREITGRRIPDLYQALYGQIQAIAGGTQPRPAFEAQKMELYTALREIDLSKLSVDQVRFLEKLKLAEYVGERGVEKIEEILTSDPMDVATAATKLKAFVKAGAQAVAKSNAVKETLTGLLDSTTTTLAPGEVLVRVAFTGDAAMRNVVDFKKWGAEWHDIARGIAMAHNTAPEDIRVVGAKTGSIILELAAVYLIAKTVSAILLESLKVADQVLTLKKKAAELTAMKLQNAKIALDLAKEADDYKAAQVEQIAGRVAAELKLNAKAEGDKISSLTGSIRKLISFIEDGGEVDCVVPESEEHEAALGEVEKQEIAKLRGSIAEIRALDNKIKRLTKLGDAA